jgi:Asp-tRNA(Asn)/Glu-tRNA(Gln) amidotransferase A subunit family amidase/Asp-tRNA(Asn)/Glu-tRNA(Gln) amidotransferase C subunit
MSLAAGRRAFLSYFGGLGVGPTLLPGLLWAQIDQARAATVTRDMLKQAAEVAGLAFTDPELDAMLAGVNQILTAAQELRQVPLDNGVAPPLHFNPVVPGMAIDRQRRPLKASRPPRAVRPGSLEDAAFWPVTQLAELLRTRQATSLELTEMYLGRLKRHGPALACVVNLTEDLALRQAREADREIAAGRYRGPLHGIPWGAKDLLAARGYPTTWGAAPFRSRVLDLDATVVSRLHAAGAVLVAKLATGELALDDVWFGGQTKNPWDLSMGSQGSSGGPASATAAGLVGFSVGTETYGSILEPAGICGVTGLRPTFGRVSRHGVMTLSWSLDKVGPLCRSVEDCALVLAAIQGPDDADLSVQDVPFNWDAGLDVRRLRVGYLKAAFEKTNQTPRTDANDAAALDQLRALGLTLVPVVLPEARGLSLRMIQWSEMNAALKDPYRTQPAGLIRQDRLARMNGVRLLPATEYLDANRVRGLLMRDMARVLSSVDVYAVPFDYGDYTPNPVATQNTALTNLTGQPAVIVPHGFNEKGQPTSLTFVGRVFGDAEALAVARAYQDATAWHQRHPPLLTRATAAPA